MSFENFSQNRKIDETEKINLENVADFQKFLRLYGSDYPAIQAYAREHGIHLEHIKSWRSQDNQEVEKQTKKAA